MSHELTISSDGKSLSVVDAKSWQDVLKLTVDGDMSPISSEVLLADLVGCPHDDEGLFEFIDARHDRLIRELSPPHLLALETPELRRSLEQLARDARECVVKAVPKKVSFSGCQIEADWAEYNDNAMWHAARAASKQKKIERKILPRMATLLAAAKHRNVVINSVAEALREDSQPLCSARSYLVNELFDYTEERLDEPAWPVFCTDDYSSMEEYVWGKSSNPISATNVGPGRVRFLLNGEEIPDALIDAFIHHELGRCDLWDPMCDAVIPISNRIVAEVRGAMARKRFKWSRPEETEKSPLLRQSITALFYGRWLLAEKGSWTPSEAIWEAWMLWCQKRGEEPGDRAALFKSLDLGDRSRRTIRGERVYGYSVSVRERD